MASVILLVVIIVLAIYRFYKWCFYRPKNFPPGPPRLPFVGSYPFLLLINNKNKFKAIEWLCQYYKSSVIGFYTGPAPTVVASDPKSIREIMFNQDFDGRPDVLLSRLREPNYNMKGIFFTDGDLWLHQPRFTLRYLRDFGFARRFEKYEMEVLDEMKSLINQIRDGPEFEHEKKYFRPNGEVMMPKALIGSMGNCFLQVCANERLSRQDQHKLFRAGEGSFNFQVNSNEYGNFFGIVQWVKYVFPEMSSYKQCRNASMEMFNFMKEIVDKQIASYQDGDKRSFVDMFIKEMKDSEEKGEKSDFTYEQLMMMCTDFLFPALSAVESQVAFLLRVLLHKPEILKKIQDEIEGVVGSGRFPLLDDRVNLPYTEAAIREILRFETILQSSVPHRTVKDTKLAGYDIPENSLVLENLHALHNDKDLWTDPQNFRPERFLDENGIFSIKKDLSQPFGNGRRVCAGETFSRNTTFLCITALLQNFNLKPVGQLPKLNATTCGLSRMPDDFWMKFEVK